MASEASSAIRREVDAGHGGPASREPSEAEWSEVRNTLRGLRFGVVEIVVQDGVIVQINRTEKRRLRT